MLFKKFNINLKFKFNNKIKTEMQINGAGTI